ncbi:succinate dehydrogenase, partial [Cyanobium sp. FGCU-52]|nr:succinate dehydrogenase [Cyanobium sp. FGCU52]
GPGDGVAALAAAQAPWIGAVLLLFLAVHLLQLRWHRPAEGQELAAIQAVLRSPASLVLYGAGSLAAGLHLFHGHEAAHRSLGLLDPANGARIRALGRLLALVLGGGFALVAVLLRFVPA